MKVHDRRKAIAELLLSANKAISGSELSEKFGVSRQTIVQDITILKGSGYEILSAHNGYLIQKTPLKERIFKIYHTAERTEDELNTIIRLGGAVADVFVWHKIYGKIVLPLNIFSDLNVRQFMEAVRSGKSSELMSITGGYHYHTVYADSEEILDHIQKSLEEKNFLVPEKTDSKEPVSDRS